MYGAILGDIIGSPYEFNANNYKVKDFPLFSERSTFTDDSVMTLAVAQAFMRAGTDADDDLITRCLYRFMPEIGRRYPNCGYGGRFYSWVMGGDPQPYNSFGNGNGNGKAEIREYIVREFGYDLSRTCDEIRPNYRMDETCQGSVPEAITAFLEGTDFEDVVRTAVSFGGDSDTIACMAGAVAEGFYGVSEELKRECRDRLTPDLQEILDRFVEKIR